jgi:hypothetical protein
MVGWASGGPQKYTGRPMRESHEHLNITPKNGTRLWMIFNNHSTSSTYLPRSRRN